MRNFAIVVSQNGNWSFEAYFFGLRRITKHNFAAAISVIPMLVV